jgi:hypothetical protein
MKACHSLAKADEWLTIQNSNNEENKNYLKLVEFQQFLKLCNLSTETEIHVAKHTSAQAFTQ